jgi:general secretion pathway protein L
MQRDKLMVENQYYITDVASLSDEQKAVCQTVIVPTNDISFFAVEMPKVARSKWAQLIPWLLEDKLLTPADDVHFAFGERNEVGLVPVAVVAKVLMQNWVDSFEAAPVENCIADIFELPFVEGKWVVSYQADYARVRSSESEGFAGSKAWVDAVIVAQSEIELEVCNDDFVAAKAMVSPASINLLQGAYKPNKRKGSGEAKAWLPIALATVAILLLFITTILVEAYQFNQTAESYRQSSLRDFERLFGSTLNADGGGLREEAEYLQRYAQHKGRRGEGVSGLLQAVDRVISKCARCNLIAMQAENNKLELTFSEVETELEAKLTKIDGVTIRSNKVGENTVVSIMRDTG